MRVNVFCFDRLLQVFILKGIAELRLATKSAALEGKGEAGWEYAVALSDVVRVFAAVWRTGGRRRKLANTVEDSMGMAEVKCQRKEVERLEGGKSGGGWNGRVPCFCFGRVRKSPHLAKARC